MAIGKKTGGGSRKGRPNKATADLKSMILGALNAAGGIKYLQRQANDNPGAFLTLVGKVLPMTIAGDRENPIQHEHRNIRAEIDGRYSEAIAPPADRLEPAGDPPLVH